MRMTALLHPDPTCLGALDRDNPLRKPQTCARAWKPSRSSPATRRRRNEPHLADALLQRVAAGDPAAVEACIDRYGGLVWTLARRFTPTRSDAEDAVQDIFVEVWRSASRFDPAIAAESTFVSMIARRRLIDRLNRQERRLKPVSLASDGVVVPVAGGSATASDAASTSDEAARASAALTQLSEEQQRVLRLSVFEGFTHAQIAEITGIPLGTVKTHIRRGLIRVREVLDGSGAGAGAEVTQ